MEKENEYLLEHFRHSGVFKCFECIYCKREETYLGTEYKCVHDGVLLHCASKREIDIMRGCACFWFEPRANAGQYVALRQAAIMEQVRKLADFANRQIPHTPDANTQQEKQYRRIADELWRLGVRL